ncbi:hypothetical protein WA171_005568 [Blastocystis sp. BT1]
MRSIDITDPKIDTGIDAMSIKSVTYQVSHNLINCYLSDSDLLRVAEALFSFFYAWSKGECFNHCFLQVLYMHDEVRNYLRQKISEINPACPTEEDKRLCVLYSILQSYVKLIFIIKRSMYCSGVHEADEMDLSFGITEESETIQFDPVDSFLATKNTSIEQLKLHFLFVRRLTVLFDNIISGTKESLSHVQAQLMQFSTTLTNLRTHYEKDVSITSCDFIDERYTKFSPTNAPSRNPPLVPLHKILDDLKEEVVLITDYSKLLTSRCDLLLLIRELPVLSLYSLIPYFRSFLYLCFIATYPVQKDQLDLLSRSEHIDLTVLRSKAFGPLLDALSSNVTSLIQSLLFTSCGIHRKISFLIKSWIDLSSTLLEITKTKKKDNGDDFSQDEIHKLTYFPYLVAFYLGVLSVHYEILLGIVSKTELAMTLWFLDNMIQQCKEWETKYITLPVSDKTKTKGKSKKAPKTRQLAVTPLITGYWDFFLYYGRGLLFMIMACMKVKLLKQGNPTFGSMDILFSQRINTVIQSGLMPRPQYDDFILIFNNEEYSAEKLITGSVMYMKRCQELIESLRKDASVVCSTFNSENCRRYQRATLMNILASKQLETAIKDPSKESQLEVSIELSTTLLPTMKVMKQ